MRGRAPESPADEGRDPTPLEEEVLGALEDMERALSDIDACKKILGTVFLRMLGWRPGAEINTRDRGPARNARVLNGRTFGTHRFRIGSISIDVNPSHPSLSYWDVLALPLRESDGQPYPSAHEVRLRGLIFPEGSLSDLSAHDYILERVGEFERAEYARLQRGPQP